MPAFPATTELTLVDETKPIDLAKFEGSQLCNSSCTIDPKALAKLAQEMLAHVDALKRERAVKTVLVGLYLCQVRAKLGWGPFGGWMKDDFCDPKAKIGSVSRRTAYHTIALAEKFARSAKITMPELIGSQQISLALEAPKGAAQACFQKVIKFVGNLGLTDLYRRHGILKKGGKRTRAAGAEPAAESISPGALAYQQMVDAVNEASAVLLNEVRWSLLTPEVAAQVEPLVKKLASDFRSRLLQARHEAA